MSEDALREHLAAIGRLGGLKGGQVHAQKPERVRKRLARAGGEARAAAHTKDELSEIARRGWETRRRRKASNGG